MKGTSVKSCGNEINERNFGNKLRDEINERNFGNKLRD